MSISRVQMVGDQRLLELATFICRRLEEISSGTEINGIDIDVGKPARGSEEREAWEDGYLAALKDIVVLIQRLDSSAAA